MKTQRIFSPNRLSDAALISRVKVLAVQEREVTVTLIAHLAELDARRLYLGQGCSSLFTHCTQVLHSGADSVPSRHIPAETKRAVWKWDGGRCAFVSPSGRRCAEDGFLQFHHVVPYSAGGVATVGNIQLRCRAHNSFEGPGGTRSRPSSADAMEGACA